MQAFGAVHLQHLRSAFAVLAAGIKKDSVVSPTAKPLPQVVENSILPEQPEEKLSAIQLAALISTQENHTQILQDIAKQLAELASLQKSAPPVSSKSVAPQVTEKSVVSKPDVIIESVDLFDFQPISVEAETIENAQGYFSRLPWSSEMFADVAAKIRESQAGAEIPQIMQLATESALKTAAEAVALSPSSPEPEPDLIQNLVQLIQDEDLLSEGELEILQLDSTAQICGAYFQTLPWANLAKAVNPEPNNGTDILVVDESPSAPENVLLVEAETQQNNTAEIFPVDDALPTEHDVSLILVEEVAATSQVQKCDDYFQSLPWQAKPTTADQTKADSVEPEQTSLQKRKAMLEAIFSNTAAADKDDFLQLLETESIPPKQPTEQSQHYFQTLPWG